ncbi:tRNA pseudouridine(38-40) synthase TruA [Clostridium tagluense]|uniref:tRNA pseudouridine(38-40) synthase TruA n=1 Tax=Clostridium tagluense TaxID=360422 RepID=UPI001C0E52AD|nr:tRNA pseudouridine(38-40) synthase TruA [Clostridium tagluense]MBU3126968.1 tRNA pseudouridine(38-40) synthase TruA [Clostridium tagluense]MCB2314077.1 tRNA pseudouridine(38-40) synthase TruA [Clostridium tagluense]MCB2318914.1 tRNA pseudouridine(38-40) synthase TruA [Clostridium tagluense]MCB2323807.1 tRNA pseudouridine(38-40) synthase TruA [Clostridium tagluense]MCB2328635.1 tRNA pseudouridine(38-40) synthase TruA [Clostridium tagluense]
MRNLKMILEYDGSRYKGWQRQEDNDLTLQGKIQSVLSKMAGEPIEVSGCVRTDVGVHAENYMANFHTNSDLSNEAILDYLYEFLPEDIVVKSMVEASEKFHVAYNIKSITYVYKINNNELRNVFNRKYVYHSEGKLNLEKMRIAAESLVGTHDFQGFTTVTADTKSTIRTINYINIIEKNDMVEIEINGNDFLWNMVRIIIASLIDIGEGKLEVEDIETLLTEKTESKYSLMAKSKGLSLRNIEY